MNGYQTSFRPNWICRDDVEVEPMTPVFEVLMELFASFRKFGAAKLGWFRMLKNSERNCSLSLSIIWKFLKAEKSTVLRPGP